jgi:hypothetical protein
MSVCSKYLNNSSALYAQPFFDHWWCKSFQLNPMT